MVSSDAAHGLIHGSRALLVALLFAVAPVHAQDEANADAPSGVEASAPEAAAPEAAAPVAPLSPMDAALAQLPDASFKEKEAIVATLVAAKPEGTQALLEALLENRLQERKSDGAVFIAETTDGDEWPLIDPRTGASAGTAAKGDLDRIKTNNGLRSALKIAIAQVDLSDDDPAVRQAAADKMLSELDPDLVEILRAHRANEDDGTVIDTIDTALALSDLKSDDADTRLAALEALQGQTRQIVYNRVKPLSLKNEDGSWAEPDERVRAAANDIVVSVDNWRSFYDSIQTLFFGLSLGSVLVLAAIGLAITFGVMGVINMAHGELMMLGAYTAYALQVLMPNNIGTALVLAVPAAFLVSGLMGIAIERGIVRFLYGRPLETLLATFGLSLILQQLVRSVYGPLNRSVSSPEWMSGLWQINDLFAITWNRLVIVLFTIVVFFALQAILNRTSLGLKVRAVSQNRSMAKAMGIRTERIDALTFGLGSGIAGVAGVALSQITNVGPNLGQGYIVDSFMVVVFGGVGNLWGTMIGGMSLGIINKVLEPWAGAVMAKILVLVFLILFIQRRPSGLFPQKGRVA